MSRDKQMINDLIEIFDEEYGKRNLITPQNTAEKLTAKGYRKVDSVTFMGGIVEQMRADVAEEIFEELDKRLDKICIVANRETEYNSFIGVVQEVFDAVGVVLSELKKKYTEGNNDAK